LKPKKKLSRKKILLFLFIFLPYLLFWFLYKWQDNKINEIRGSTFVIIDKSNYSLKLYKYTGELIQDSKIAYGKIPGNKRKIGDLKTPEGIFSILSVEDASGWEHDFKDDTLGKIKGAYGPYFIRLSVPGHKGIGIHGTHDNNSIGSRASEGCIRMKNEDLIKLVKKIKTTSVVAIIPGIEDQLININSVVESVKIKQ
jgi:lipoprotein-anchoring transpeptidase ErfK/SrfK